VAGPTTFSWPKHPPLILSPITAPHSTFLPMPFGSSASLSQARGTRLLLSLSSSEPTRLLLLILPAFPEGRIPGPRGRIYQDIRSHLNQDAASEYYQAVTQSLTHQPLCHNRHQARCAPTLQPHYQRRVPAFFEQLQPPPQLGRMIMRRAVSPVICFAVKQIEYPPPVSFSSSSFLPCPRP